MSALNFQADDTFRPIRYITYNIHLMLVATATEDSISIWEWQESQCILLILVFKVFSDLLSLGPFWKKIRTFLAHNSPVSSRVEGSPVQITSLHWLRKHKGVKAPLLVSFLHQGVK